MKKHLANIREKAERHKTLIQNFSYLSALQVFNMLLPLITLPYLLTVLGADYYGLIVYAQAITSYFVMFVNFGFNIYGTKEISLNRNDKSKISEISSNIILSKGLLFIASVAIMAGVLLLLKVSTKDQILFYLTLHLCFYEFILPLWYFQGIEKMKYITFVNLLSKLTFTVLIFIIIKNKEDYILVPLVNGLGSLIAGLASLYILLVVEKVKIHLTHLKDVIFYIKESSVFALSNISSNLKDNLSKVLIGIFLGHTEVTYFDIGEKILRLLRIPVGLTVQTIFPRLNQEKDIKFLFNVIKILVSFISVTYIFIVIFSKSIVLFLGGEQLLPSSKIVILLNVLIIPNSVSFLLMQILIPLGHKQKYLTGLLIANFTFIFSFSIIQIVTKNSLISITILQVVSEFVLLIYIYLTCVKLNIINSPFKLFAYEK
ncbi:MAG: oligosaccharide flippase family protein [Candidatus Delongbacteria bacterium]|nr:oligosaccharide flippase family protein [Candidatus Delongbacteria bacterium]